MHPATPDPPSRRPPALARALPALAAFTVVAVLMAGVLVAFHPIYWETNDDVSMAMVANGYGMVAQSSPSLIYVNIAWGWLVSHLPDLAGAMPYAWLTMLALAVVGGALLGYTRAAGNAAWLALAALLLAMVRPIVFPSYTQLGGMAAAAAIVALLAASGRGCDGAWRWLPATALFLLGCLLRPDLVLLMVLVAVPLLPWRILLADRRLWAHAAALAVLVAGAFWLDARHYATPAWDAFNAMETVRVPYTDYGVGRAVLEQLRPEAREGFSRADLALVQNWFFLDPAIADPPRLGALLAKVDMARMAMGNADKARDSLGILARPELLPLVLAALVAAVRSGRRTRLLLAWALFAAALVALGLLGRPAKLRICVPVVAMLLFAALQFPLPRAADWRRFVLPAALVAMLATTLGLLWRESGVEHVRAAAVEAQVAQLPRDRLHVVWSGALPVEVVFPVWIDRRQAGRVHLTEIGAWSLAPFTRDQWRRWHRGEFREELATRSVSLIAPPQLPHWLGDYCREHLGRPMRVLESQRFDDFTRQEVTCAPR